jgi:hypothetical protein
MLTMKSPMAPGRISNRRRTFLHIMAKEIVLLFQINQLAAQMTCFTIHKQAQTPAT